MSEHEKDKKTQGDFLNRMRQDKAEVEVALISGEKLIGNIISFDEYTVLLKTSTTSHLIFKSSVCYIHEI